MPDIVQGKIGEVGAYDVAFSGGKLIAKVSLSEGPLSASIDVAVSSSVLIKAIEAKVGNVIAKEILDAIAAELDKAQ